MRPPRTCRSAISGVLRRLPRAMPNPPTMRKIDPSAQPIFFVSLFSDTVPIEQGRSICAQPAGDPALDPGRRRPGQHFRPGALRHPHPGRSRRARRAPDEPSGSGHRRQRHQHQPGFGHAQRRHQDRHHPRRRPARQCRGLPQPGRRLSQRRAGHFRRRRQGGGQFRGCPFDRLAERQARRHRRDPAPARFQHHGDRGPDQQGAAALRRAAAGAASR